MRRIVPATIFAGTLLAATLALAGTSHQVPGEIASVDSAARTLVVKEAVAPRKEVRLTIKQGAQIIESGKAAAIGDLKAGERVHVTYLGEGSAREATRVEVLPSKG